MIKEHRGLIQIKLNYSQAKELKKLQDTGTYTKDDIDNMYPIEKRTFMLGDKESMAVVLSNKQGEEWKQSPNLLISNEKDIEMLAILHQHNRPARMLVEENESNGKTYNNVLMVSDGGNLPELFDIYTAGIKEESKTMNEKVQEAVTEAYVEFVRNEEELEKEKINKKVKASIEEEAEC